jgi:hypothetical protein
MESALIAKLLATAGVTALVSTRINWGKSPQGTALPRVVLHKPSRVTDYHHGGASGLAVTRVQADCYGTSYGSATAVLRAIETALCGASFTQGSVRFDVILNEGERDGNSPSDPDPSFLLQLDLMVHHANAS